MADYGLDVCQNQPWQGIFGTDDRAPPLPRPDFFNIFNKIMFPLILYVLFTGISQLKKRHPVFEWMVTIIASIFVCLGTLQRVSHIHGTEWDSTVARISRASLKFYFTHSLVAWIACIVLDGRHTVNMCRAHGRTLMQSLLRGVVHRPTFMEVLEALGLLICCLSMGKLAGNVYGSYNMLSQSMSLHAWFFLAVFCKLIRIIVQGLVILTDVRRLRQERHRSLTAQLTFSSIFLLVQVLYLAQFSQTDWPSLLLLVGDILYRVSQLFKIWWYNDNDNPHNQNHVNNDHDNGVHNNANDDRDHGNDVHNHANNGHNMDGNGAERNQVGQEETGECICFLFTFSDQLCDRLELPPLQHYYRLVGQDGTFVLGILSESDHEFTDWLEFFANNVEPFDEDAP